MGKPEFKSPRSRNILTKKHPISRTKSPSLRPLRSTANIRVVVRVRPPNEREHGDNSKIIIKLVDEKVLVFDPKISSQAFFYHGVEQKGRDLLRKANKDMQFMFDRVFGFDSTNAEIFENTTKDLIKSLMDGFNCSVFAYGATGAGKTHTMLGHTDNPGITFLTMAELFNAKQELCTERNFELAISYLEVYNETVQDLLQPGSPLQLRDDGKYGVTVAGIKVKKITNPDELFSLLAQGNSNRTQHPTDANAESSRSHAVFQVYVQMEFKASREVRTAKLSMIDLAGSERGSATGFGGARFTEGANINKSLLALGNCINSLADGQRYVPYRDSKLTRLLKDSLGGNCQTVMIANISPSSLSFEDTYNTLKYATRAKKIKSDIKRNVVNVDLHVGEYVKIVTDLKRENDLLKRERDQFKRENDQLKCELKKDKEQIVPVQTANVLTPINTKRNLDSSVTSTLKKLIEDRRRILDRMHNIEVSERNVLLRRQLKDEANSRLSGLLTSSPEKEEAHQRIGKTIDRFQRQVETFHSELNDIKANKVQNEAKMVQLMKKYPELETNIALEHEKLLSMETQYQMDVMEKERGLMLEELKSRAVIMEKACKMLRSCYLQLKGHGFVTDALTKEYQNLVNHYLQRGRNITWEDAGDSGMSSSTSSSLTEEESQESRPVVVPIKRKLDVVGNNAAGLDMTYLLEEEEDGGGVVSESSKAGKVKVCTEELMVKVACKPPLAKRRVDSSHPLKENKRIPNNATTTRTNSTIFKKTYLNSKQEVFKKPPFRT